MIKNFYGDYKNLVNLIYPWSYSGGAWGNGTLIGEFAFTPSYGEMSNGNGSRLVISNYNIKMHRFIL